MAFFTLTKRALAGCLCLQLIIAGHVATKAQAEMVSTGTALSKYAGLADKDVLLSELQTEEVRTEMIRLGVDPDEAEARLQALSNEEIASILSQVDADEAGGNGLIGALLTVFIILLITDLLCLTRVFSFTRCAR